MVKKILFTILLFPLCLNAQTIKGIVKSQATDSLLDDANIYAIQNQTGTLTNSKGEFSLNLKEKTKDSLQVSHIGFITVKIAIKDLKKINYIISLKEDIENLNNVEVKIKKRKLKSKIHFEKLAPLKNAVFSFASLLNNGKIYVTGGDTSYKSNAFEIAKTKTNSHDPQVFMPIYFQELRREEGSAKHNGDFLIYDIKTNTWENSNKKLIKRAYHSLHFYDNSFYIFGGKRISPNAKFEYLENQIEIFDLSKNEIAIDKTNPHQAINSSSFIYKDNIIVMGGAIKTTPKGKKTFTNKTHFYNLTSGLWYELSEMPIAQEASGILIDEKIYLIGGNNGKAMSEIQSFDLINDKWLNEGELFSELEKPAIASQNNLIYIFDSKKIYLYDIKTKVLKEFLIDIDLKYSAMHIFENNLYIIGGLSQDELSSKPSNKTYCVALNEFQNTSPSRIKTLMQKQ
ncbi:carboxypeptidase-like regulatory domain-containing protein [Flavobacterium sp. LHD-85]|uniref:Kelch repeat-containing protein n=1 Tax=Flavobacterium sp. LHD-85 TaxID=3071410 RepID=UPI0027E13F0E|nr:carboxypeptidase-like regulatory domain-containing protein [Flavobacterium sp. LHD-85]MDQ6527566.1 carboxypeptidase-like regulatory domain-containing protein [Flavobacterium sp. LHD-85]